MSLWQPVQIFTASVFGGPGVLLAWGLWQSVQSPMAPGCGTFAVSISFALSSWQVVQRAFTSGCVSTTFPSLAGAWQVSQLLPWNGTCWNFAISLGESDWWGSWHCVQFAVANGWLLCAFCRPASLASWQSRHSAGAALLRWNLFSWVGSAPVLCTVWQVSHPPSRAMWRLPFSGTFKPVLWQLRQRFSFSSPDSGFSNWFLLALLCGSWQVVQSRTDGGCTVPLMSAAFLSAWQVRQSETGVAVM